MNRLFVATVLLLFLLLAHDRHGVTNAFTIPSLLTSARTVTKTTTTTNHPTTTLPFFFNLHQQQQTYSNRVVTARTTGSSSSSNRKSSRSTQLWATPDSWIGQVTQSLFAWQGPVPLVLAAAVNAVGFATLATKLATMLTPAGLALAFALGTGLWATLGWRGWIYCVLYFFFGQAVTKLRFQEKEVSTNRNKKQRGEECILF